MATDVRTMTPVGKPTLTDDQRKAIQEQAQKPGDEAIGFGLAMSFRGIVVNQARDLQRIVMQAFDVSTKAREIALRNLNEWRKELKANAEGNPNLLAGGMTAKDLGKVARSANTRVSEFTSILKAMDAGMGKDTLALHAGVEDVENIGFHVIVQVARTFLSSAAAGAGRPADPFEVKLAKWLKKQHETAKGADVDKLAQAEALLAPLLPVEEPAA